MDLVQMHYATKLAGVANMILYHSMCDLVGEGDEVDRLHLSQISIRAIRGWGHSITAAVNDITLAVHWL